MILAFLFSFCLAAITFGMFMVFRVNWVYELRMKHIDASALFLKNNDSLYDNPACQFDECMRCVWSFEKMVQHFWINGATFLDLGYQQNGIRPDKV